jgi:hypothetical protein
MNGNLFVNGCGLDGKCYWDKCSALVEEGEKLVGLV